MKKMMGKKRTLAISLAVFCSLIVVLVIGLFALNSASLQTNSLVGDDFDAERGELSDDPAGAMEYEYNMIKDPATGKIPEGIFTAERAQADAVLKRQRQLDIPEFASYNFVGPDNLGGRTRSVVYDVRYDGNTNRTILAGGVSNGVYKSVDDGASWVRKSPTGDHFSCTSIAQDPRPGNQDTWYYTVGENLGNSVGNNSAGAFYVGNGVYKSVDNGETWNRLPNSNTGVLENFDNRADLISKVTVDPTNGYIYIAAVSTIQRSTDGGSNWSTVLSGTFASTSQITDVVVTSTGLLYAALPGDAGNNADGVYQSQTGAANSWVKIAGTGSPTTPPGWNAANQYGRVVLAVAPTLENRVYALYYDNTTSNCASNPKPEAEFFYWNNNNSTWTDISRTLPDEPGCDEGVDPFADQKGYDLVVSVKPDNANTIFIGGTSAYRSTNTGATWTKVGGYANPVGATQYPNSHADIHSFVFQPGSPAIMLSGNDGGVQRTTDDLAATVAWTPINNGFRTYQYFYVANDPRANNNKVIGGAQDNGTTRNIGGSGSQFEPIFSGDGVSVGLSDPAASGGVQYEYVGTQNGNINRRDAADPSGVGGSIRPATATGNGLFITLFKLDPDNTQTLYYANGNSLYRTNSASTVTTAVGSGANEWARLTGVETAVGNANITSISMTRGAYNPATSSLFIGTADGRVFRLDNPTGAAAAATPPFNITGANFMAGAYVSSIAVNPINDSIILVTFSNYNTPSIFWTNQAKTAAPAYTNVENNLPLPSYRSSAIVNNAGTLEYYAGTSAGLYRITGLPAAGMWTQEGPSMIGNAVVANLDLRVADNKLLVGTHGIGMLSSTAGPTAAGVSISGRVLIGKRGLTNATVYLTNQNGETLTSRTTAFGYYHFDDITAGQNVVLTVVSKRYQFAPQVVNLTGDLTNFDFNLYQSPTVLQSGFNGTKFQK